MASDVEKIKERLTIEEVVGSYVELNQSGKYLQALSPFTNEKTPSFYVSPDKGLFHCFSSGKGGDIFTFIQEMEGVEFREALKLLADRAGVSLSGGGGGDSGRKQRLHDILAAARDFYARKLKEGSAGKAYLTQRGIEEKTADIFKLGEAPDDWRQLTEFLQSEGYRLEDILEAGLAKQPDNNKSAYDRFRGRLLFPLNDPTGRPVAFSGRRLKEDDKTAKYINSPETPLYHKKKVLYGFDLAKDKLRELKAAILVEGQIDLVLAHQAGFSNTVASSGTAITTDHLKLLQRFTDNLILALDTDTAGRASTLKTSRLALTLGMNPKVAALPDDTDPADIINGEGKAAFKAVIAQAKDVVEVAIGWAREDGRGRQGFLELVQRNVFPLLSSIENKISQDHYIEKVSQLADIREQTLRSELLKLNSQPSNSPINLRPVQLDDSKDELLTPHERKESIYQKILTFIEWLKELEKPVFDPEKIKERIAEISKLNIGRELSAEVTENDVLALDIAYEDASDKRIRRDLEELLLHFEVQVLQDTYERASRQVAREVDKKTRQRILEKCQKISRRIHEIREKVRELV